jgi:hypothetical protein
MRPGYLKTVNLRWSSAVIVCYLCWSLERFRLVDATTSKYSVCNNTYATFSVEDKKFILPKAAEIRGQNGSEYDSNVSSKDQY